MSKKGLDTSNRSGVLVGSVVVAAVVIILVVLALTGVFSPPSTNTPAAQKAPAQNNAKAPNNNAQVQAPNAQAQTPAQTSTQGMYPFGKPSGGVAINVPPPPGQPTLSPTIATKTTTRLYGEDPFEEAVSITQHVWPAARSLTTPSGKTSVAENNNDPDRPWGLTLLTPDDPLTAITAVPLIHFPNDAPVLYVTKDGIPEVTRNEIKRLGDTGISRYHNVDAFLVGEAANPAVENQLKQMGLITHEVTADSTPELANKVDKLYGSIENPDTGVPNMGNGSENVMIGSMDGDSYQYLLPSTHWVSHMATGLQWVHKDSVPQPTIDALKRRDGMARIYVFGGPDQISSGVVKQLSEYGTVTRITNNDIVAFNANPKDTPIDTALAFAKMYDPMGMVGWGITGPGHGFTLVRQDDWQAAVASAPLSHLGFHAPLLLTDSSTSLPSQLEGYYKSVAPTFLQSPAEGPYNMTYVLGSWDQIGWDQQADIDYISEMHERYTWNSNTGSRYTDSGQF
jgi:hypothetical protein